MNQSSKNFFAEYHTEMLWALIICVAAWLIGGVLKEFFPLDTTDTAKMMHFFVGVIAMWMFWYALEQHRSAHRVNPIWFFLAGVWGASGVFFFRWLLKFTGIYWLRRPDTFLYTAFPDWDGLLFGWRNHRQIFFHSEIVPVVIVLLAIAWNLKALRDFGIGLTVGVASHLVWDIIHGPFANIRHLDYSFSALWMLGNALIGVFLVYFMVGRNAIPGDIQQVHDS